jgi:hypothetical protein
MDIGDFLVFGMQAGVIAGPRFGLLIHGVADGVFGAADAALHFTGGFFGHTFGLDFGIAGDFADSFLDGAFDLLGSAFDTIFIHGKLLNLLFQAAWIATSGRDLGFGAASTQTQKHQIV